MEQRGFIEEATSGEDDGAAAFWQALGHDPAEARRRLAETPVQVVAIDDAPVGPLLDALQGAGARVEDDAELKVVVTTDYRHPAIDAIDREAVLHGRRWALVKPVGVTGWVGPFFEPPIRGCWTCLADRIRMNLPVESFVEEQSEALRPPRTSVARLPSTVGAVSQIAATELAKWIVTGSSTLAGTVATLNAAALRLERHTVTWRPQCPRCGDAEYRAGETAHAAPRPIPFVARPRLTTVADAYRTCTPAETLRRFEHFVSPITGVVTHLERISPPGDETVHAYAASHNWATHPDSLAFLKRSLRSRSGGKGQTDEQARVGALAEAFERYSGVYRGDEIRRRTTLAELGGAGIHPNEIMLFSEGQYERREEINSQGNAFQMVPNPFDASAPTEFSPLWSPTAGEFFWVPTGLLYYSYSKAVPADEPNRLAFYADSNGCASGNTLEEAALQALLELVERDAVATWWYNRVRRPAVDLAELDEPFLPLMYRHLEKVGRDLWVLDITNDIGIPVFAAFSRRLDPQGGSEQLVVGFGAHLEPRIGILRAITEVNQFFASLQSLDDADLARAFDPGAVEWWRTSTRENQPYVVPAEGPLRRLGDFPRLGGDDLLEGLTTTISRIEARGPRVLLLDQTRPDLQFPVIKAIVPGMRHFWSRLAPGRLYDVPVELGWLDRPLREDELNPVPVFF
jgi:ribosomal protein S12 methylthiotransferase accessory factor